MTTERRIFGTDGIRGTANRYPLTPEMIVKIGRAAACVFKKRKKEGRCKIVIGKDTRLSGYILESALAAGICSAGVDVILIGPLPTPGISFITRSLRADAGIVLSASHNSFEDNGIKFFLRDGLKLPDQTENEIEELFFSDELDNFWPVAGDIGKAFRISDANGRYIEFVKSTFPKGMLLDGFKIVLDCANGAAYHVAPAVFKELDALVVTINDKPDGRNINQKCGATDTKMLKNRVLKEGADIGIALDGDGDRLICVDEKGNEADGDIIIGICALDLLKKNRLKNKTVVTTFMSNVGLESSLSRQGITLKRTSVGDRYVLEEMVKTGSVLGGEPSGHIICKELNPTGDGLISALQVLKIMKSEGTSLSELRKNITLFPQVLKNVKVKQKDPFGKIPGLEEAIRKGEKKLGNQGRILVRYSGTERKVRILVEGKDGEVIEKIAGSIVQKFQGRE